LVIIEGWRQVKSVIETKLTSVIAWAIPVRQSLK
jgi:hypothetical protein